MTMPLETALALAKEADMPGYLEQTEIFNNGHVRIMAYDDHDMCNAMLDTPNNVGGTAYLFRGWDDGHIPMWVPGGRNTWEIAVNPDYIPTGLIEELQEAWERLGSLGLAARWARAFRGVRATAVQRVVTGYTQGDESTAMALVTDEWLEMTGADLERVKVKELNTGAWVKEFSAWAAGDHYRLEFQERDPLCEETEPDLMNWQEGIDVLDIWSDYIGGPEHTLKETWEWLAFAIQHAHDLTAGVKERRDEVLSNGHYVI
jgi:hypothetical protein